MMFETKSLNDSICWLTRPFLWKNDEMTVQDSSWSSESGISSPSSPSSSTSITAGAPNSGRFQAWLMMSNGDTKIKRKSDSKKNNNNNIFIIKKNENEKKKKK